MTSDSTDAPSMELPALARPPHPGSPAARRRSAPRGRAGRNVAVALLAIALVAGGAALNALRPWETKAAAVGPLGSARYFLAHYERRSGRVVRLDQGGDTVSEGESYALLLAVATGDRPRFAAAWDWTRAHLQEPTGLLAWHYAGGKVVGAAPASDADLDTAWALILAGQRFGVPAYAAAGAALGRAVLAYETVQRQGAAVLVAGPWARRSAPMLNPSYFSPMAAASLASAGGGQAWAAVAVANRAEVTRLLRDAPLPPDWAVLDAQGVAHPSAPLGLSHTPVRYGFDAVRVPIWLASSCAAGDRHLAARLWPTLSAISRRSPDLVGLDLGGTPRAGASANPVGRVALAASAAAAGRSRTARTLLGEATAANLAAPTYYGSAWVALGEVLLTTHLLGGCSPLLPS